LAFNDGEKKRTVNVKARDLEVLQEEIRKARIRFGLERDAKILSCYEAGRDGFWLHRYLLNCGIENMVVDSASIEVSHRKRRGKTDRINAINLLKMLLRYVRSYSLHIRPIARGQKLRMVEH
jgi:transposase